jgi:hypothetical protein
VSAADASAPVAADPAVLVGVAAAVVSAAPLESLPSLANLLLLFLEGPELGRVTAERERQGGEETGA